MLIHFWGVRGSLPTPLTPQQVQSKIMAAVQRVTADDIKDEEARARFVSSLPSWIFGTAGGNTTCVEVKSLGNELIFDAGTGLRLFGKSQNLPKDKKYNFFFTHFHWDHIQGFPFFDAAYDPESEFNIYSALENTKAVLEEQMNQPYYPVPFTALTKKMNFMTLNPGAPINIGDTQIVCCPMSHPGTSYSYAVIEGNKKFVFATDVELRSKDFDSSPIMERVFKGADCIVIDSQYTAEEAYRKQNWGHSAFCYAVDFAVHWGIKNVYLFHHEPTYDDKKLYSILQAARWYAQYIAHEDINIQLAKEDMEIQL
ncbi:MAG: MBL fold metallo-hydrolase [Treponema sp.]|nr:MBL fold metallo-hydrolase [Treponema sp.]